MKGMLAVAEHVKTFKQHRAQERLEAFRLELMGPVTDKEREELLNREFSPDDFTVILESVLADVEFHKIPYYAKLFRALVTEELSGAMRSHLIRSFRSLCAADFQLMEKVCAATQSDERMPDSNAPEHIIRRLLPPTRSQGYDPLAHASAQSLISWGYLKHGERDGIPWPTTLAVTFAKVAGLSSPRI